MTREQLLDAAIKALRELRVVCAEYSDLETAQIATKASTDLQRRRDSLKNKAKSGT